jgi:hypothetical protein
MLDDVDDENPLEAFMWTTLRGSLLLMLFADEASRLLDEAMLALVVVL